MKKLITIYCDAGFKDFEGTGGAYIRIDKSGLLTTDFKPFPALESTYAELFVMLLSIEFLISNRNINNTAILLVADNKAALSFLWPWKKGSLKDKYKPIVEKISKLQKEYNFEIKTKWVKGHQSERSKSQYCNHFVDKLATQSRERIK